MKRALTAILLAGILTAQAADYQYLTIEKTDGTALSLPAIGLTISYADNNLTAVNGTEGTTIAMSDVNCMYFSETPSGTTTSTDVAVADNTVEVVYNGSTATVNVASNISQYVTVSSGTSSHVVIKQAENFAGVDATADNEDGEIIYTLSGKSDDGEFYLEGSFKASLELSGLTLTNPNGPAINIQDGKRISVSVQKGTASTLTDGANEKYNGSFHCKGHTKFKGKGTLNVVGNSKHAIYSKEYMEVKNCTINVTAAVKDAIHCKEYFFMESGTINITAAGDDGIQVELDEDAANTGITADHEDENTGNFYQKAGTLSISGYTGKAIKADGTITYSGGKQDFDTADTEITADISALTSDPSSQTQATYYDLQGRPVKTVKKGLYIFKKGNTIVKTHVK